MLSDSQLAIAAASGDRDALADIYGRYANTLHELCRVILHDAHEASDALHDTFVIAATRLHGLRDPARLKPWLCAIARHESMRRSTKRARSRPVHDEALDVPVTDAAAGGLMADETAALVWDSAESLTERERAVLMLNVRQGLEGAELAAAAGLPGPTTSVLLSRAKTQLAAAVRCTLLIRHNRAECSELASLTPRKHAALDALTRKRVTRHAAACALCEPKWNASPDALGVLAAAPLLGAPVAMRHNVLNDPRLISFSAPLGAGHWQRDGFPPDDTEAGSRRRVMAWSAAALVTLLVATGLVFAANDQPRRLASPPAGGAPTTDPADLDFEPWPTSPPPQNTTTTRKTTTTTIKRATTTTARRPAANAPTTAAPQTTTTAAPPFAINASTRANTLECGTGATTVSAQTNRPPSSGLLLRWSATDEQGGKGMNGGGTSWTATLGPFTNGGSSPKTVTWWVQTLDGTASSERHTIPVTGSC